MKKLLFGTIVLSLVLAFPVLTMAMGGRVDVGVRIPLPPPIVFAGPPHVVVIPETYVYGVPDVDVDFFFYGGWWWRPWKGRWYRSKDYNSGWSHYQDVPSFHREIPRGWRNDYKNHRWKNHQWNPQRIPHQEVQRNWGKWEKDRHWEKQNTWGVKDLRAQTDSRHQNREVQPQSRPDPRNEKSDRREIDKRDKRDDDNRNKRDDDKRDRR
jgi:hypothetical protein